jgi:hypothetical protein
MTHGDHLGTTQNAKWTEKPNGLLPDQVPSILNSPEAITLLGLQLWLNLPKKDKMTAAPAYHGHYE